MMGSDFITAQLNALAKNLGISRDKLEAPIDTDASAPWSLAVSMRPEFEKINAAQAHFRTSLENNQWLLHMKKIGPQYGRSRQQFNHMMRKHEKWPLDMPVATLTPQGYIVGKVHKHDCNYGDKCSVDFAPTIVDIGDANGARYCHVIPFRNLRKI